MKDKLMEGIWEFQVDDGLVLARPDVLALYLLNSSAGLLWTVLSGGGSTESAVQHFVEYFGITAERARLDIDTTLAAWSGGMLAPASEPIPPIAPPIEISGLHPLDCLVNGTALRVLLEPGEVWTEIAPRLEPVLQTNSQSPQHTFAVFSDGGRVHVFRDGVCIGSEELSAGARAILLQAMAGVDAPAAILHAGGCAGVLLAGETQSGKTTLCAALMAGGMEYHCDDSVVLDREFRVAPAPFGVMLREGSWKVLEDRLPALKSAEVYHRWGMNVRFVAPTTAPDPSAVKALMFVRYEADAETTLEEVSVFECLLELERSGFWVEHTRERIQRFLEWLGTIGRYRLRYGSLEEAEAVVKRIAYP